MTIAVCIKCGCEKFGAFTPCDECGFNPTTEDDKAKAICLSDWAMSDVERDKVSAQLKDGKELTFNQDVLDSWKDSEVPVPDPSHPDSVE